MTFSIKTILLIAFIPLSAYQAVIAQTKFINADTEATVKGTSTLHDWEMNSKEGKTEAVIELGSIPKILALKFTLPAESLKSHHSAMDKNAYKTLKTEKYAYLTFVITSSKMTAVDSSTFNMNGLGQLEIAGVKKEIELNAVCKVGPDKSLMCTGSKQIKMSDYGLEPPSMMLGTVKTGNEITIDFKQKLIPHP